jgi:hypothetical protein
MSARRKLRRKRRNDRNIIDLATRCDIFGYDFNLALRADTDGPVQPTPNHPTQPNIKPTQTNHRPRPPTTLPALIPFLRLSELNQLAYPTQTTPNQQKIDQNKPYKHTAKKLCFSIK